MYRKNTASQYVYFCLVNATTGAALTGATVTAYRALDNGAQASATGTTTELANGQYRFNLSQADTNGDYGSYLFTATNAVPVEKTVVFTAANPTDAAAFGLSRLDATVGSRMATYTQPTGFLTADFTRLDATVSSRMATYTQPTGFLAANFGNLDAAVSSRMATYTQPTGFLAATFPATVASPTNITSASGVTLAATTHTGAVIPVVSSVTQIATDGIGTLSIKDGAIKSTSFATGAITAASIAASALNGKGDWLNAAQTASAVWDALLASYTVAGSFGARVMRLDSASSGNGAKVTAAGHVAADIHELQAGVISSGNFATGAIDANALAADAATEIATAVAATQALSRLDSMIESDGGGQFRFDTIALSMAPAGGGGGGTDWTASERTAIRSILGFDSGGTVSLPTVGVLDGIKDKTDLITSGSISVLPDRVNDNTITMQFNESTTATVNLNENTTSATLQFVVARPDGTDVLTIANGSISRTSSSFTVTITTAVTATIGQYLWSLRDLTGGGNRVVTKGVLTVQNAAAIDA